MLARREETGGGCGVILYNERYASCSHPDEASSCLLRGTTVVVEYINVVNLNNLNDSKYK